MEENEIEPLNNEKAKLRNENIKLKEKIDKLFSIIVTESLVLIALLITMSLIEWIY